MSERKIRFAVVGLGNIAQAAVLPAFKNARETCELAALVSSNPDKLKELSEHYDIEHQGGYDDLERIFQSAKIDAAYLATPNTQHRAFAERCARAGVHVLCEKPMAMNAKDCEAMSAACDQARVKLMVAYRLHFDAANLRAIDLAQSGQLGELRFFSSTFGQQVRDGDIRTQRKLGGGALFDMGIYCLNAARNLFGDEPEEVFGFQAEGRDTRFQEVDELTTAVLRFPNNRFAQFTASQGSVDMDEYRIVGTEGALRVEPAFGYQGDLVHHLTLDDKTETQKFSRSDQFAPELLHFAKCILEDSEPEPSGQEGLADVRVLEAITESAHSLRPVSLRPFLRAKRPGTELEMKKPAVKKPLVVQAPSPSK